MSPATTPAGSPYDVARRLLVDAALCPACVTGLTSSRCSSCGLDVSGLPGQQLWELSQRAADALRLRAAHLQHMRLHQAAREKAFAPAQGAPARRASTAHSAATRRADGWRTSPAARRPSTAVPTLVPRAARPHWQVQTVLQVLGASLLAAASIVFLVFTWGRIGIVGRAVAVGVGTLVVFVLAWRLRKAALRSAAEAVGALGAVMLVLDAWAVQATGLLHASEPASYAAIACLACAALLLGVGRATRLRVTTAAGTALLPLSPALLAPIATGPGAFAWLLVGSVMLAGARFAPAGASRGSAARDPSTERLVLTGAAWLATIVGTLAGVAGVVAGTRTDSRVGVGALGALGGLAALQGHLALTVRTANGRDNPMTGSATLPWTDPSTPWAAAAGTITALAAASAGTVVAQAFGVRSDVLLGIVPCASGLVAAVVAVGATHARRSTGRPRTARMSARVRAVEVAADGALAVALALGVPAVVVLPFATVAATVTPELAGLAVLIVSALVGVGGTAALLALARRSRPSRPAAAARRCAEWLTVAVALGVPPSVGAIAPALTGTGVVVLLLLMGSLAYGGDRRLPGGSSLHVPLRVLTVLAASDAFAASLDSPWLITGSFAAAAVLALGVRAWMPARRGARAVAGAAAVGAAWQVMLVGLGTAGLPSPLGALVAAAVGLLLVVPAALDRAARWHRADRCTALAAIMVVAGVGWVTGLDSWDRGNDPPGLAPLTLAVAALATAATTAILVRGAEALGSRTRHVAGTFFAPVATGALVSVQVALGSPVGVGLPTGIAAVGASSVLLARPVAAVGTDSRRTTDTTLRPVLEITGWLTTGAAILVAVPTGPGGFALALLVAAVACGAWSLQPDRRWARWGVLILGVSASWVLLLADDVGTPELYLAPAGLVLTVLGVRRRRLHARDDVPLLAAGLTLAVVPSAVLDGAILDGRIPRVALTLTVGALMLLIGLRTRPTTAPVGDASPRRPGLDAVHVVLAIGLLIVVLGPERYALRAAVSFADGSAPRPAVAFGALWIEAWSCATTLVVAAAAARLSHLWPVTRYTPRTWGPWLVAVVAVVPSLIAVDGTGAGLVRWMLPLDAGAILALIGARQRERETAGPMLRGTGPAAGDLSLVLGISLTGAAALTAIVRFPHVPADVPLALLGAVVAAAGVLRWRRAGVTAPWPLAGPLLLLPAALDQAGSWRAPVALAEAFVLVMIGVVLAPRAPTAGRVVTPTTGEIRAQRLLLLTGAVIAVVGPGFRAVVGARTGVRPAAVLAVEAWSLPASVIVAVAVLAHARTWAVDLRTAGADPHRWGLALVLLTGALPVLLAVDSSVTGLIRAAGTLAIGAGCAVVVDRHRRVVGLGLAATAAITWAKRGGPEPADLPIVVFGGLLLVVGCIRMAQARERSSWPALGPGLMVTLVVPVATGWQHPTAWRLLLVLVGAAIAVVLGAVHRWQAPFAVGGVVLMLLAVTQLSPAAVTALRVVEWWMLLAACGAILLGLGLTYERRLREAREAVRFVSGMR